MICSNVEKSAILVIGLFLVLAAVISVTVIGLAVISDDSDADPEVPVTGVYFYNYDRILEKNKTGYYLDYYVVPENATNKNVTWNSSAPSIASVDEYGVVTTYGNSGTATITVTTEDGHFQNYCEVRIQDIAVSFFVGDTLVEEVPIKLHTTNIVEMPYYENTVGWRLFDEYGDALTTFAVGEEVNFGQPTDLYAVQPKSGEITVFEGHDETALLDNMDNYLALADSGYKIGVPCPSEVHGSTIRQLMDAGILVTVSNRSMFILALSECPVADNEIFHNEGVYAKGESSTHDADGKYTYFTIQWEKGFGKLNLKFIGNPDELAEGQWILETGGKRYYTAEEDGHQTAVIQVDGRFIGGVGTETHPLFLGIAAFGGVLMLLILITAKSYFRKYVPPEEKEAEE